jgi:hypothetical protein
MSLVSAILEKLAEPFAALGRIAGDSEEDIELIGRIPVSFPFASDVL